MRLLRIFIMAFCPVVGLAQDNFSYYYNLYREEITAAERDYLWYLKTKQQVEEEKNRGAGEYSRLRRKWRADHETERLGYIEQRDRKKRMPASMESGPIEHERKIASIEREKEKNRRDYILQRDIKRAAFEKARNSVDSGAIRKRESEPWNW